MTRRACRSHVCVVAAQPLVAHERPDPRAGAALSIRCTPSRLLQQGPDGDSRMARGVASSTVHRGRVTLSYLRSACRPLPMPYITMNTAVERWIQDVARPLSPSDQGGPQVSPETGRFRATQRISPVRKAVWSGGFDAPGGAKLNTREWVFDGGAEYTEHSKGYWSCVRGSGGRGSCRSD